MGIPIEVLEAELLQLPKVRVSDRVVASLDADADAARDAAWDAVAAERDRQAAQDASVLLNLDSELLRLRSELQ